MLKSNANYWMIEKRKRELEMESERKEVILWKNIKLKVEKTAR